MTSAEQLTRVAEYQARVDVLKALLAEAETRLAFFKNVSTEPARRVRYASVRQEPYPPAPFSTAPQPQETCSVAEVLDTRTDAERVLDHRSGSGENSAKCREQFEEWLANHGIPGDWHKTETMCSNLYAWQRFTKHVVDAVLEQMVTDGLVEVERNPWNNWPRRIRLQQPTTAAVY